MRNALFAVAIAALCVSGCRSATMEKQGEVKPAPAVTTAKPPAPTPVAAKPASPSLGEKVGADPARGYEIWKLVAQVPQEAMDSASKGGGCPRTITQSLFGFEYSSPHGCVIGKLTPGGPAERAGLKVGDGIASCNGREVSCPSSLEPAIRASFDGPTPGHLVLLIHRPLSAPAVAPAPAPGAK